MHVNIQQSQHTPALTDEEYTQTFYYLKTVRSTTNLTAVTLLTFTR